MKMPFRIGNIINKVAGLPSPAPVSSPASKPAGKTAAQTMEAVSRGATMPTPILSRTAPPAGPPGDPFIAKFTVPPYFNHAWNGRVWTANPEPIPAPFAAWFIATLDKRGMSLSDTDKKSLAEIALQWAALEKQINDNGIMGVGLLFHQHREQVQARIAQGDLIGVNQVQSREALYQQSLVVRQGCRETQKALSRKVHAIMRPFCERVRTLARELTEAQNKEEQETDLGFSFRPSGKLRGLIYLAVDGWQTPIRNYFESNPYLPPAQLQDGIARADWYGVELFAIENDEAAIAAAQKKLESEKARADWGRQEEARRHEAAEAESCKSHAEQVEALSKQNDEFREGYAAFRKNIMEQRKEARGDA